MNGGPVVPVERRHAIPDVLLANPPALALWIHFRNEPHASLKDAAAQTKISTRYAYKIERWLIQHGLLVEVRFGNGHEIFEQRLVINPQRNGPERRAVFRPLLTDSRSATG